MPAQLSVQEAEQLKTMVADAQRIVITSHKSPDGDAAGSALAVHLLLKKLGKNVHTILPDDVPDYLHWLPGFEDIVIFDHNRAEASNLVNQADLIFSLDYNNLSRLGREMEPVVAGAKADFVLVDHHQQPGAYPKIIYSDTAACSTCEMVYRMIETCGWMQELDIHIAACIYCGIMTDSGSFRFPSVTQATHEIAGKLIALGLDHASVHRAVYDTNLIDRLKLIGYALSEKLEVLPEAATALIWLSKEELERFNHRQGDTEGLANQALSIKGVKLAAFFREGNSEVKVSFRSKGSFDVNNFARKGWNGGGHSNAAGGSTQEKLEAAVARFRKEASDMKQEISNS